MSLRNRTAPFVVRRAGSRARMKSSGFTLVELLVVISIIGMLMALLLPAINNARETGRQNTCRSNLSNVAVAMISYDSRNGRYPGYMNVLLTQQGNLYKDIGSSVATPVSWAVELLTDLDRSALYEQWRTDSNSASGTGSGSGGSSSYVANLKVYLEIFTCPSDDANRAGTPTSYVLNTGMKDLVTATAPVSTGMPRDFQANGMFFDNYSDNPKVKTTAASRGPEIVMRSGNIRDPKDKTIMFTENVDAGDYTFDSTLTGDTNYNKYSEVQVGCIWDGLGTVVTNTTDTKQTPVMTPTVDGYRINFDMGKGDFQDYKYCRPSSRHPQGVNVAFMGKNVVFMRDTLSYFVFAKLMSSDDALMKVPGTTGASTINIALVKYQINDADINP
ncbi:MAG: DUF1559 domain-containing protein [Planctomycetia bacterium]|nr:DUF1559 domain-containing protein [Planctomycetia bacterium]